MKTHFIRHPKGKVNAIRNGARNKAVPPDNRNSGSPGTLSRIIQYAMRLFGMRRYGDKIERRIPFDVFFEKCREKFKTYKKHEIRDIYYMMTQYYV